MNAHETVGILASELEVPRILMKLSKEDLRDLCREAGLEDGGTRNELIERLLTVEDEEDQPKKKRRKEKEKGKKEKDEKKKEKKLEKEKKKEKKGKEKGELDNEEQIQEREDSANEELQPGSEQEALFASGRLILELLDQGIKGTLITQLYLLLEKEKRVFFLFVDSEL